MITPLFAAACGSLQGLADWSTDLVTDLFWKDCPPEERLPQERRAWIEQTVQRLAREAQISRPVQVFESKECYAAIARGGSGIWGGAPRIIVQPEFVQKLSDETLEFVLAHEVSHLKNNDIVKISWLGTLVGAISAAVLAIFNPGFIPSILSNPSRFNIGLCYFTAGSVSQLISKVFYIRQTESRADSEGFAFCSESGKRGAIPFFEHMRRENIKQREGWFTRMTVTPDGENLIDIGHPLISRRIQDLVALARRAT